MRQNPARMQGRGSPAPDCFGAVRRNVSNASLQNKPHAAPPRLCARTGGNAGHARPTRIGNANPAGIGPSSRLDAQETPLKPLSRNAAGQKTTPATLSRGANKRPAAGKAKPEKARGVKAVRLREWTAARAPPPPQTRAGAPGHLFRNCVSGCPSDCRGRVRPPPARPGAAPPEARPCPATMPRFRRHSAGASATRQGVCDIAPAPREKTQARQATCFFRRRAIFRFPIKGA